MLDDDNINTQIYYIIKTISKLDLKIEQIEKKITEINHIYIQYNFNKNLKLEQPSSYLKFQVDFLYNEKNYYSNTKKYFIEKFVDDLYNISDHVILILISLNDLDIGYQYEKDNIMNKIIKITKQNEVNSSKIIELVSCLINNFKLCYDFILLFEKFITTICKQNKKRNIHSKNLKINLTNKKNHYDLETNKYSQQITTLVNYFYDFSTGIDSQLNTQKLLHFFVNNKNI